MKTNILAGFLILLGAIWAGEGYGIICGSVGKSNLLQHLADSDSQKFYLGAERTEKFKSVMIDPNLLGAADDSSEQFRCWAGYELLMHRLYLAFFPFTVLGEDAAHFFEI